jgi:geranylgeranyl reductase
VSADYKRSYKKTLNEFLEQSFIKEKILDGEIVGMESHPIPMGGPLNKLCADRTILVGDAGGFVFSGTGEGIYYAIKSGRVAGEAICQALEAGQFDGDFLGKLYAEKLEKSGLSSLREVDFAEKVLSSPKNAEKYVRTLKKLSIK